MCKACDLGRTARSAGSHRARLTEVMRGAVSADTSNHREGSGTAPMVPLACDNRLTGQSRRGILHGLMQGCVKAQDAGSRRGLAAAVGRHLQPSQPAGNAATLGGIQSRQRRPCRKGRVARAGVPTLKPEGERALGETVSWAEGKFDGSGGHKGSRVSWPWKITKPSRILNWRYPFVKPFVKV